MLAAPPLSAYDKVLAHADRQLVAVEGLRPGEQLPAYRRFLKIEEHRLRLRHRAGGAGLEICRARVELLDILLRHLFTHSWAAARANDGRAPEPPVALLAIGGYGRGELNPFSDVDLLFLHDLPATGKARAAADDLVQQVLYLLWDVGFKVGHATRSVPECIAHANKDNVSKTALLEARRIAGPEALWEGFRERFIRQCVRGKAQAYLRWRQEDQSERHRKFGQSVFVQEPNLKAGPGGLRDYHNLFWSAYFVHGEPSPASLVDHRLISEADRRELGRAHDFLLRVRTELHYLNGRALETLTLAFQGQIADRFSYPGRTILKRSEAFMKDYYRHTRAMHLVTDNAFGRLCREADAVEPAPGLLGRLLRRPSLPERFDGFISRDGLLYAERRDVFNEDPFRLLRAFVYCQERTLALSPELSQLMRRRARLVDRTFTYAKAAREIFFQILSHRGQVARVLRQMHEVNLLGRYLPEFGGLTCLVQHEFSHRYTADEHTLVCIEKLDALVNDPASAERFPEYRKLFDGLADPAVLYLAILLHDTGKATSARQHAEASAFFAQKAAARLQIAPERRRELVLLVDHHITLSSTAQTRNLEDPDTVAEFAGIVKNRVNLDALMLLTLADGQGTSDEGWSDWKESLVWQLYRSATRWLENGAEEYRRSLQQREVRRVAVKTRLGDDWEDEIGAHFGFMPDRYFESFNADAVVAHLALLRRFFARQIEGMKACDALNFAASWTPHPARGHTEVVFAGWRRRDGLTRIAGSFAAVGLNILGADAFERDDELALNVLRVCDKRRRAVTDPLEFAQVEKTLGTALAEEEFDFTPLLQKARRRAAAPLCSGASSRRAQAPEIIFPTRIVTRDAPARRYTLLEVQTADRLGLLHDLLAALNRQDVRVALSRVATEKGGAVDSFYLTDPEGRRIADPKTLAGLRDAVRAAVG